MTSPTATPSAASSKVFGASPASFVKPSPASTFGDSTASDAGGCPKTPGRENDEGVLLGSVAKLSINDGNSSIVERYSPPFVRKGVQASVEDPFATTSRGSPQATPTGPKSKGRAAKSDNWRSGSSSGSSAGRSSPSPSRYLVSKRGLDIFVKKCESEDDQTEFYQQVAVAADASRAQSLFPPACCVFVANLLQSETDESLEVAVTQVFREFGSVWVKIRRDGKQMPFAFCQYREPEHAERAIRDARGRLINGRPCRVEKAKAHRLFFVERKYGAAVTPDEVAHLLRGFGQLDFIRLATPVELAQMNLNEGVLVQFKMYDDGQTALQAYRNHHAYKMQSMANMCSPTRSTLVGQSSSALRRYLETYEVDKRSIFLGNLPAEIGEVDLHRVFEKYGAIAKITLHKNESVVDATQKHCFAFIEFKMDSSVRQAVDEMNQSNYKGKIIRVCPKDTEGAKLHRKKNPSSTPAVSYQSPPQHSVPQQPVTPLAHAPGYGSPYAYPYGSPYYSAGYFADAQGQHYPASPYGYSPFYAYTGNPSYVAGTSTTTDAASSPNGQSYYGYYPQFPYWGYSPTAQQPAYFAPSVDPTVTGGAQEDRSATPTPTGQASTAESSMESE